DPDINKTPTEFSLSGTKLSGETPGQTTTKQSPVLLASASSAKSPAAPTASAKTAGLTQKAEAASENTLPTMFRRRDNLRGRGRVVLSKTLSISF
ncbi:MAG: hypothetical protein KKH28_05660, partial [Elusimicrobia bacterium]|nr:hypothetical protein [Elusimicrobiota bacterium]